MATYEFKLPDLGEGITEGEVVKWLVKAGQEVREDQPLIEVMTDKATVEIPSPRAGRVAALGAEEGATVSVGHVLIVLETADEAPARPAAAAAPSPTAPAPARRPPLAEAAPPPSAEAAPAVRGLARTLGVELAAIKGTGPGGRITQADVRAAGKGTAPPPTGPTQERVKIAGLRKQIADHLARSFHTAAMFTYVEEADLTDLVALREKTKDGFAAKGLAVHYLPFIARAAAEALLQHPYLNATVDEERQEIILHREVHLGIAAATQAGLVVPVVRNAEAKEVGALAREIADLAEKCRTGRAEPKELKGSTFTITSLGALSGILTTPIVNHPETAILGVNRIVRRPVVRDGAVAIRQMVYLSLTCDHRIVDGHVAAAFMRDLIRRLEEPTRLLD